MREFESFYIDGQWVDPVGNEVDKIVNPATEEVIGSAPVASVADADRAITAARVAFDEGPWAGYTPRERQRHLERLVEALERRAGELEELVVAESGVARARARALHIDTTMNHLRFFTEMAGRDFTKPLMPLISDRPGGGAVLGTGVKVYDPVGVVSAIVPYNAPFLVSIAKVAPALAMGNSVVLKPSPFTPLQTYVLASAIEECEFPAGVFNLITGGPDVGVMLSADERIDLVTFTGSESVGIAVMEQAARSVKKVLLELGGKSALIIREDADMDRAVAAGMGSMVNQTGQGCSLTTRHLVHRAVHDEYVERLVKTMSTIVVGDPSDLSVQMGPLIRESQRERVERLVEVGVSEGATVAYGGGRPANLTSGYFVDATVLTGVQNESTIAQEEVFGPVASVIAFDDDDHAVRLANGTRFGLGGAIISRDSGTAFNVAKRIRTGQIGINGGAGGMSSHAPFGGVKRSGLGREYGEEGVLEFAEVKAVTFNAG